MKVRWQVQDERPAGHYRLAVGGKEPLDIVVDENGFFETEGFTDYPLYIFARLVRPTDLARSN